MLKYHSSYIGFREIPDEISLCINITNCPNSCIGCHSPWLQKDVGTLLTPEELKLLIECNKGITCVCFMGGDSDPNEIVKLANLIRITFPNLFIAWYSGQNNTDYDDYFDFIKLGHYDPCLGPLNNSNTNQRLYQICHTHFGTISVDITNRFWNDN